MPIEYYQDLPNASDEEVIEFLREQIHIVIEKYPMRAVINACFNTIIGEIKRRLESK